MTRRNHPDRIALFCDNQRSPHTARNALYRLRAFARWLESEHNVADLERVKPEHILGNSAKPAFGSDARYVIMLSDPLN